jgi:hypothetical protein
MKRAEQRGIIKVEQNGRVYILAKANTKRLETRLHPLPSFMGHDGYILLGVKIKRSITANGDKK